MDDTTGLEIAVIGMSCKFPGADGIEEFWNNLKNGIESIIFSNEDLVKLQNNNPNYVNSLGGIIDDRDQFDPEFFGYKHYEAFFMDPQVRLFHECVYKALNDGACNPFEYKGLIGLFGSASSGLGWQAKVNFSPDSRDIDPFTLSNLSNRDQMCTQVSYRLNLKGPSVYIGSTCSSSLVAIHIASQSLLNGECDLALAGGVCVNSMFPKYGYEYKEGMIGSKDGHCRTFDQDASGTVGGEGCGIVLLKPLEDAINDNDNIYAVIKGSAINNDGNLKLGYTAPGVDGQSRVIQMAHRVAQVDPESILYIEAHGTGTKLGDPLEMESLNLAFNTSKRSFCGIGSVKTNIGHLDAASGVAGFIKTALAIKNREIPPSLNFNKPNPEIGFEYSPFYVNAKNKKFDDRQFIRCGVSSFGIGGTNAHVIIEQAPEKKSSSPKTKYEILLTSANSEEYLQKNFKLLTNYIISKKEISFHDACFSLQTGRKALNKRLAFVCRNKEEIISSSPIKGNVTYLGKPKIVFMFPGQGNQYFKMGMDLYNSEEVFRSHMENCFSVIKTLTNIDFIEVLFTSQTDTREELINTFYVQPLIFSIEYALAKTLMFWGIMPDSLIGHSIGEYTAACLSGVFELEDALKIVTLRGKLMSEMPKGKMISVSATRHEITPFLNDKISLAAVNGISSYVLSGETDAVDDCINELNRIGKPFHILKSSHAFHSHMMDNAIPVFVKGFESISLKAPKIHIVSNYTGKYLTQEEAVDPSYWGIHLRNTVQFHEGLKCLLKDDDVHFIEVGPGNSLKSLLLLHEDKKANHNIFSTIKHAKENIDDTYFLLSNISLMWVNGIDITWDNFHKNEELKKVSLPPYLFEKNKFWIADNIFEREISVNEKETGKLDISRWFYVPVWKHSYRTEKHKNGKNILIFANQDSHCNDIISAIKEKAEEHVVVYESSVFSKSSDNIFHLDPLKKDAFKKLFEDIPVPDLIIYLWGLNTAIDNNSNLNYCFYYPLFLVQSIIDLKSSASCSISFVTNIGNRIIGNEKSNPIKSLIDALSKVVNMEIINLTLRSIDTDIQSLENAIDYGLLDELTDNSFTEAPLAYRNGLRWSLDYENVELKATENKILKQNGTYILTGGMGPIGLTLLRYLTSEYQSNVILTTRNIFPKEAEWDAIISGHDKKYSHLRNKISAINDVNGKFKKCWVETADVSNPDMMKELIDRIELQFGKINGVFHLAGETSNDKLYCPVELTTREFCKEQFTPKLDGVSVLYELFKDRETDFILLASSLSSVLGGLGFTAYSAANRYLDTFIQKANTESRNRWISINFDGWNFRQREEIDLTIEPTQGIETIERILNNFGLQQVIVATSDLKKRIFSWNQKRGEEIHELKEEEKTSRSRPNISTEYVEPLGEHEKKLHKIFNKFFHYDRIGAMDSFFELGGDSLLAVTVISIIHKELDRRITINEFYSNPHLRGMAGLIESKEQQRFKSIKPSELKEYYDLSSIQKRIHFADQINPESLIYNLTYIYQIQRDFTINEIEVVLNILIQRHEALRTAFAIIENSPKQFILKNVDFVINRLKPLSNDYSESDLKEYLKSFVRPYNLTRAPLFRVGIIEFAPDNKILLFDFHHIIFDAVTFDIIIYEFVDILDNKTRTAPKLQYKDFSEWHNKFLNSEKYKNQLGYWKSRLNGYKSLSFPTDFPRSDIQKFEAGTITRVFKDEYDALINIMKINNSNTFSLFVSLITILLSKYSGQKEILIGTETAGRPDSDLFSTVGMFVGLLPICASISKEMTFGELMKKTGNELIHDLENQNIQFDDLIKELGLSGIINTNPLFNIIVGIDKAFTSHSEAVFDDKSVPVNVKRISTVKEVSIWDLRFGIVETVDSFVINLNYSRSLFKPESVAKLLDRLQEIIKQVINSANIKIEDILLLNQFERLEASTKRSFDNNFNL